MSGKSIWSSLSHILGGGRNTGSNTGAAQYVCPNGHPMDPSWDTCPRCEAEKRAHDRSMRPAPKAASEDVERNPKMAHHTIIAPEGQPEPGRSGTRVDTGGQEALSPSWQGAPRRKITGVLVSFTWDRQGDLFVLYEGRNVIGKGYVESEGGRPCDVLLQADVTMSDEHAVILCRAGRYELFDRQSTNGTFVDDAFVESNGVVLKDGAKIRTGSTVWLMRKLESDPHGAPAAQTRRDEPFEPPAPRHPSIVR
jgi:hypothetical protein